jgi:hypothetical protein
MTHKPGYQREEHTEQDAGDDRKVKSAVFPLVVDITRQPANPERKPSGEDEKGTHANQQHPYKQDNFAEVAQRIHPAILT